MSVIVKSNNAYAGSATLPEVNQLSRSAADLYAIYAARVVADGGTIQDPAACQAAIAAALVGGYYYKAGWAISPRWGVKLAGSIYTKFYSLMGSIDGVVSSGQVDRDTTTFAWATALFDNVLDVLTFTGMNVNRTGKAGIVGASNHPSQGVGLFLLYNPAGQAWSWNEATGETLINGVSKIKASSEYAVPQGCGTGMIVEQDVTRQQLWFDGAKKKVNTNAFTALAANVTANQTLQRSSAGNVLMHEFWFFNAATPDAIEHCSYDVGGRY